MANKSDWFSEFITDISVPLLLTAKPRAFEQRNRNLR